MTLARLPDQDIIIIGATGDLARRKLLPALYNLHLGGQLPRRGKIIGYARSPNDDEGFRRIAEEAVKEFSRNPWKKQAWQSFAPRLQYVTGTIVGMDGCGALSAHDRRLIYLAIPPSAFIETVKAIGAAGLARGTRVVVEKPFGTDLASSRKLTAALRQHFDESQVYRIDHYLGKETVQNTVVFRFGNSVLERIWNRDAIDHVQFTVAETIGVEGRGGFYEETGALRDILENHVFQVLSLLTMEPPASLDPEAVRDEKSKLFNAMRPIRPEDVVRGQYTSGRMGRETVPGYREEPDVAKDSKTETYAAVRLFIDNWRWAGVPFYLRTGKRLVRRTSEVAVVFREAPVRLFAGTNVDRLKPNLMNISIQPEESITFQFLAKVPGPEIDVQPVEMEFCYDEAFKVQPAEAYERLLHDAMEGDPTLFARSDGVDRTWEVVQPVLDAMPPIYQYKAGTWGPKQADALISPRLWHLR